MRIGSPSNRPAASWMRPFLCCAAVTAVSVQPALGEAIPTSKADLIRRILSRSILSQTGHNIRGRQAEHTPATAGTFHIHYRSYARTRDGKGLAIVTDSKGARIAMISDDGQWNRSYDPRTRTLTVSRSMRIPTNDHSVKARVHRILSSYRVTYHGLTVMAGRACHKMTLDPHDVHGRPIRVWIDAGTGVTLAREESDRRGNSFRMTTFHEITYPKKLNPEETSLAIPKDSRVVRISRSPLFRTPGALKKWASIDIILPMSMPRGFEFEAGEVISLAGTPAVCLRYTDGLAVITLFQTQTSRAVQESYQSVAWKMLPRGENIAVSGQTQITTVVIGPRESDGIVTVARALERQREMECRSAVTRDYGMDGRAIASLRDRGLGLDCIVGLLEVSRRSGRKLGSLLSAMKDGRDWRQIAALFKINPNEIAPRVHPYECR